MTQDAPLTSPHASGASDPSELRADLLVIGGGMAGMTAAAYAASCGAQVVLLEKAHAVGGSAALSGGGLVCPRDVTAFAELNPSGDVTLMRRLFENYWVLTEWIDSLQVPLTPLIEAQEIVGFSSHARTLDVKAYFDRCRVLIERAGGYLMTDVTVESLTVNEGCVVGLVALDREGRASISAPFTVLATGGFQNNAELRTEYIGEAARSMVVRSNKESAGDGLRLAASVGAGVAGTFDRFYGHTMPDLGRELLPSDYIRHAQFFLAPRSLMLDASGHRFTDESAGYYLNAQELLKQPNSRALLVGDQAVRDADTNTSGFRKSAGLEQVDRIEEARREGALVLTAQSLDELDSALVAHGYRNVAQGVRTFNEAVVGDTTSMDPPRLRHQRPLDQAPYWAMEVQPAITFTFGGIQIDQQARVLRASGEPIPGLLSAGADTGGVYCESYSGGLSLASTFGLQAAVTALSEAVSASTT